jgi:hypothetical protein
MPSTKPKKPKKLKSSGACAMRSPDTTERRKFGKPEDVVTVEASVLAPKEDVINAHLHSDGPAFYTGKRLDAKSKSSIPCTVSEGKVLAEGKLELAFFSKPQMERYNKANPASPQIPRPGPVLRMCRGSAQPLVVPVADFEDGLVKAETFRTCVLGKRGAEGRRPGGKGEAEACATKLFKKGTKLALGRIPKRRKARR